MLTDAQLCDTRRWLGYQLAGTTQTISEQWDITYLSFGMVTMSLFQRLNSLSAAEEAVLINTYLTPLASLETDIVGTAANLDTDQAAVWYHNKYERQDREALFDSWRRRLCGFIGCPPGPDLGAGGNNIALVRA
jgi:hypothetical protein